MCQNGIANVLNGSQIIQKIYKNQANCSFNQAQAKIFRIRQTLSGFIQYKYRKIA